MCPDERLDDYHLYLRKVSIYTNRTFKKYKNKLTDL